ncbi:hypothetical protein Mal4_14720 [Maioricimonas rarisocia]|uniref:Uncharacterized protein n=1 Tax=Maioricimonas rarisocia TaxID=2528026 RepID=A0A517Z3V6_9PLAN|nr:hypothetical protein [Maioricimonas rarisocia]QDU37163.1 hypothetical protein Mal4_14720 [Maioricimonas rarisocia]
MSRNLFRSLTLLPALLLLGGFDTPSAFGSSLDEAVNTVTQNVKRYLDDKGENAIAVGTISGPKTGTGRLIETKLAASLKEAGIEIVDELTADWELRGRFAIDPSGNFPYVALTVMLVDSSGVELSSFSRRFHQETARNRELLNATNAPPDAPADSDAGQIKSGVPITKTADIAVLAGTTTDLQTAVQETTTTPVTAPVEDGATPTLPEKAKARDARDEELKQALAEPSFHVVSPSTVAASDSSPFHVEIRAATTPGESFVPMNVEKDGEGRAFVPLAEGNQYGVHVINNSTFDVGVELLIDGINTLEFAENPAFRENGKWIIAAGTSGFIKGWFINSQQVDTFIVTPDQQGVAATLGRPQQIGTITATFYPAWVGDDVPAFEQLLAAGNGKGSTGRGEAEAFRGTILERQFGTQPLAIVSLNYNNPVPPVDLPGEALPE